MKIAEIQDRIQRSPGGGQITSTNRWDKAFIISLINTYRAEVLGIVYNGNRTTAANNRINNIYYQNFFPVYSKDLQESDCFNKFIVPPVITLDDMSDGFRYIGSVDGSEAFKRIKNRETLSNLNFLSKFAPKDGSFISALYDGYYMEIYGQDVRNFMVSGVFQDPFDCPTYNPYKDEYPMDEEHIPIMEDLIFNKKTEPAIEIKPSQDQPLPEPR